MYRDDDLHRQVYAHRDCFPNIDPSMAGKIKERFLPTELREALFSMQPWKAPGIDGIQAGFFQQHWNLVGADVCSEVLGTLEGGEMDSRMNKTIICLIPKVEAPSLITQFRPVSLCSVLYKLVTKTIASRLMKLMPLLIGPIKLVLLWGDILLIILLLLRRQFTP